MKEELYIAVVSNIILEPYFEPMAEQHFGKNTVVFSIPFGEYKEAKYQTQLASADLIVVWLNLEVLLPKLFYSETEQDTTEIAMLYKRLYVDMISFSKAKVVWLSFEDYFINLPFVVGYIYNPLVDKINAELSGILTSDVSFIDLKRIIAEVGVASAFDPKSKYRWNAPYSKVLVEVVIGEIYKQYLIGKGITKKCLVLDCDNVLWGGILSEDGIENLKLSSSGLGRSYQDFQRFVLLLYQHGVILAVCSKNDLLDVLTMFREHREMVLKEEHIACFQVNWEDKPSNINRIAEKLNIGLDSIVFVDDSFVEIEAVKEMLPEITSILFKRDMNYKEFSCFSLKKNVSIEDIKKRNTTFQTNEFREKLKAKYTNYKEYIAALQSRIDIHEVKPIEYSRLSELTQRTNKCTNGKRYTVEKIKERVNSVGVKLYSVSVSDQFSDLGLVGAIEIERDCLTLFSLSCRALGREIEKKMIEFVLKKYQIKQIEFKLTDKNEALKILLDEAFHIIL